MEKGYTITGKSVKTIRTVVNRVNAMPLGNAGHGDYHRRKSGSGNAESAVAALITGGNSTTGFDVDLYGNGVDQSATGMATGVRALDMAAADSACIGEYVMIYPSTITIVAWEEGT